MKGMFDEDKGEGRGWKLALLTFIVLSSCFTFVYSSYMYFTARMIGDDVYVSWVRLERSLEAKAEYSALLAGYLVQRSGAEREMFDRIFSAWDDILSADKPRKKMEAGQIANNESYGIIALAKADSVNLNKRVQRILEGLESLELSLAADIENYNMSVSELHSSADEFYFKGMFIALTGCGEFDSFSVWRQTED